MLQAKKQQPMNQMVLKMVPKKIQFFLSLFLHCVLLHSLLHHVVVDEARHERDSEGARTLVEDISHFFVLESDDILTVDFGEVVVYQNSIPVADTRSNVNQPM